jgi:hypothetical protein
MTLGIYFNDHVHLLSSENMCRLCVAKLVIYANAIDFFGREKK